MTYWSRIRPYLLTPRAIKSLESKRVVFYTIGWLVILAMFKMVWAMLLLSLTITWDVGILTVFGFAVLVLEARKLVLHRGLGTIQCEDR